MSPALWLRDSRNQLDIVAGLIDGILNALTLAAGRLLASHHALNFALVWKVAAVTASTSVFVFFVAHYAQLRSELVHSERELNLLSHGRLATTQLGKQVLRQAISGALVASVCGLIGSAMPLALCLLVPGPPILGLLLSIVLLGLLGWLLAWNFFGSSLIWSVLLMLGGVIVTCIGVQLDILG